MSHSLRFLSFVGLFGLLSVAQGRAQSGPTAMVPGDSNTTAQSSPPTAPGTVYPDSVYINPEVRPQFTGGDKAFAAYLSKSIRYPQQALMRHVSGRVYVSFILNAQGKVQDVHVVSGPGSGLNDEALRLVWLMPPWQPGRVNGQAVRVACTIPISFNSER
jgi:protein TonB